MLEMQRIANFEHVWHSLWAAGMLCLMALVCCSKIRAKTWFSMAYQPRQICSHREDIISSMTPWTTSAPYSGVLEHLAGFEKYINLEQICSYRVDILSSVAHWTIQTSWTGCPLSRLNSTLFVQFLILRYIILTLIYIDIDIDLFIKHFSLWRRDEYFHHITLLMSRVLEGANRLPPNWSIQADGARA